MKRIALIILMLSLLVLVWLVHHMTHPKLPMMAKDYVQAIVGEAADQDEDTMICVADALRNRGTLKGVNGYKAKHIWFEKDVTWQRAWLAWMISARQPDKVHGAKNFGTANDLIKMGVKSRDTKAQCGDFLFY